MAEGKPHGGAHGSSGLSREMRLDPCFEPLAAVIRGRAVESLHRGAVAVVDVEGRLVGGIGDPLVEIVIRSAAKPFQTAAVVESGAADAFGLDDAELAVITASHAGAPEHVRAVQGLLDRVGTTAASLVCGSLEHMCSGKHAGMILLAHHLGVPAEGYEREDHPVQQYMAGYVGSLLRECPKKLCRDPDIAGTTPRALSVGSDGCGVPAFGLTLCEGAWLYASLAAGTTSALRRVRDAMIAHPVLVAGETRFDTLLMRAADGRVVAKGGAEGVQGVGLLLGGEGPSAGDGTSAPRYLGCVVKVEDGSARAVPAVVTRLLRSHGLVETAIAVEEDHSPVLRDRRGVEVGRIDVLLTDADLEHRSLTASERTEAGSGRSLDRLPTGLHLFGRKDDRVTVCRGDEKEVLRFLRDQWPSVDEQYFGRRVEWSAEPHSLVFRREGKIVAVLKGHFIGGIGSVDELMVDSGARGSGLGSLLLGSFEEEARRRGCIRVVLRAVKGSAAEDFYRGRGYHRECVQFGYEFGYDYVRLARDISQDAGEAEGWEKKGESSR
jgi:L-asparaginase II/GNAT superfamily N-acetyltransferase